MSHIALVTGAFTWRGAHKVMAALSSGFAARGHRVTYLTSAAGEHLSGDKVPGTEIVDFGTGGMLRSGPLLRRWLTANRPDILLSATEHVNLVSGLATFTSRSPTRVFASCHSVIDPPGVTMTLKDRVQRAGMAAIYPKLAGVIAVSAGVAESLSRVLGLPRDSVDVIYNPVVTPAFEAQLRMPATHPFFVSGHSRVLVGAGGLTRGKGFDDLIEAVALARVRIPVKAIILGEGPERSRLEASIESKGLSDVIALPGYVPNPGAFMQAADLFVLSSRFEGFGLVLAEALAVGTPVVSTDCPAGPAEILDGGTYGRLVPVRDAAALARAIVETLNTPPDKERLISRGRTFSLDAAVDRYLDRFRVSRGVAGREAA